MYLMDTGIGDVVLLCLQGGKRTLVICDAFIFGSLEITLTINTKSEY